MSTNTAAKEKKKWAFPLGVVTVILAVIGLVTVIVFAVRGIGSLTDNSDKFEKYEQFLAPVIMRGASGWICRFPRRSRTRRRR